MFTTNKILLALSADISKRLGLMGGARIELGSRVNRTQHLSTLIDLGYNPEDAFSVVLKDNTYLLPLIDSVNGRYNVDPLNVLLDPVLDINTSKTILSEAIPLWENKTSLYGDIVEIGPGRRIRVTVEKDIPDGLPFAISDYTLILQENLYTPKSNDGELIKKYLETVLEYILQLTVNNQIHLLCTMVALLGTDKEIVWWTDKLDNESICPPSNLKWEAVEMLSKALDVDLHQFDFEIDMSLKAARNNPVKPPVLRIIK